MSALREGFCDPAHITVVGARAAIGGDIDVELVGGNWTAGPAVIKASWSSGDLTYLQVEGEGSRWATLFSVLESLVKLAKKHESLVSESSAWTNAYLVVPDLRDDHISAQVLLRLDRQRQKVEWRCSPHSLGSGSAEVPSLQACEDALPMLLAILEHLVATNFKSLSDETLPVTPKPNDWSHSRD